MLYELRIYYTHPGRLQAICDRFANLTLGIFPSHGIKVTEFWVDAASKNAIYYLCEFADEQAQKAAWDSFEHDPVWIAGKAASEADGPIVERIESYNMIRAEFFTK